MAEHRLSLTTTLRKVGIRSNDAVIRVYDAAGSVAETHGEQAGDFKEWRAVLVSVPSRFCFLNIELFDTIVVRG
jgi:hypothetical protein